jgi:hypothetical protein
MPLPKVYLDANVFKFSATQLPRLRPRQQIVNWGGRDHEVIVHDFIIVNPNDTIPNPELKEEADLLPKVAELGKSGYVQYVIQTETLFESWGLPDMDSATGAFYGAPYMNVDAPITYGRIVGGRGDPKEVQFEFLKSINSPRFTELQRMTGAYQGEKKLNRKQLLDAFHLWCAEHNKCAYFLTLDFKLTKVLRQNRQRRLFVNVVRPSELLTAISDDT